MAGNVLLALTGNAWGREEGCRRWYKAEVAHAVSLALVAPPATSRPPSPPLPLIFPSLLPHLSPIPLSFSPLLPLSRRSY